MDQLKELVDSELVKQLISPRTLLARCRGFDENSVCDQDPKYLPFYYHLGKFITPKSLLEIGFNLGFCSTSFLTSCKSVENFLAVKPQTEDFYSARYGKANVREVYFEYLEIVREMPETFDQKWDLVLVNEKLTYDQHRVIFDTVWPNISEDGHLLVEHLSEHESVRRAFFDFCKVVNRNAIFFNSKFVAGMVKK